MVSWACLFEVENHALYAISNLVSQAAFRFESLPFSFLLLSERLVHPLADLVEPELWVSILGLLRVLHQG